MRVGPSADSAAAAARLRAGIFGLFLALAFALTAGAPHAAPPVVRQDEVVLEDQIALDVIDRDVWGFDAVGGGRNKVRLELGESVLATGQRGRLALVVTDRRDGSSEARIRAICEQPATDYPEPTGAFEPLYDTRGQG